MGKIFLNPSGDGAAYCIPAAGTELANGERFEIISTPYLGASLVDIRYFDSYDHSVALPVGTTVYGIFDSSWGNLYVDIYFSGGPVPPTPTSNWLIPVIKTMSKRKT